MVDGQTPITDDTVLSDLQRLTRDSLPAVDAVFDAAKAAVAAMVTEDGRVSARLIDLHQTAAHGLAWLATYQQALHQMQAWADRLADADRFTEVERLILQIAFGEYLSQIAGGIQMNQTEVVRCTDLGLTRADLSPLDATAPAALMARGNTQAARTRLAQLMQDRGAELTVGASGLDDELEMIRDQFRRFSRDKV